MKDVTELTESQQLILAAVEKLGTASPQLVEEETGIKGSTIRSAMPRLKQMGFLEKLGTGLYQLASVETAETEKRTTETESEFYLVISIGGSEVVRFPLGEPERIGNVHVQATPNGSFHIEDKKKTIP